MSELVYLIIALVVVVIFFVLKKKYEDAIQIKLGDKGFSALTLNQQLCIQEVLPPES